MKHTHAAIAGLALLVSLVVAAVVGPQNPTTQHDVRVVALLSLTGPAARFDAIKQRTLEMAKERVATLYPHLKLNLEILDAGASPDVAQAAARRAVERDVKYVLTGTSLNALAVAAIVRDRVPPIVQIANAANPNFGPPRSGEYRFWPDWHQESRVVTDFLRRENMRSVLVIHSADPYSEALTVAFREFANDAPPISIRSQQYDPAATPDFRPLLLRALSESVDALVIFGLPPGIAALMGQLADVNWDRPLVGGVNTNLAGEEYDKVGLTCPLWVVQTEAMSESLSPGSEADRFRRAYTEVAGVPPPFHALYLADALFFIAEAERTAFPGDSPVQAAARVDSFNGVSGLVQVSAQGVLSFEMTPSRVK